MATGGEYGRGETWKHLESASHIFVFLQLHVGKSEPELFVLSNQKLCGLGMRLAFCGYVIMLC